MMVSYSLRGITRAGSKGMISARNIKAPHLKVLKIIKLTISEIESEIYQLCFLKKEKQLWKRVEFL
ncbi:MAG: hypothetical protein ACOYM7_06065, partial [Paludibacter sp.]